jgi:hypothetical protein
MPCEAELEIVEFDELATIRFDLARFSQICWQDGPHPENV